MTSQMPALHQHPLRAQRVQSPGRLTLGASSVTSISTSSRTSSRFGVTSVARGNSWPRSASSALGQQRVAVHRRGHRVDHQRDRPGQALDTPGAAIASMIAADASMPVFAACTPMSSATASIWPATTSGGISENP